MPSSRKKIDRAIREFLSTHRAWHASDGIDTTPLEALCEAEDRLIDRFFDGWEADWGLKTRAYEGFRRALLDYNAGRYAD